MSEQLAGKIRLLTPNDGLAVGEILNASRQASAHPIGPIWSTEQLEIECHNAKGYVFEAVNGQVRAFILFRDVGQAWEVSFLATAPMVRGKGLMGRLFSRMMADLPAGSAIWLEVHESNLPARALYEKLGFHQVGTRPRYYPDGGAAVLYNMDKRL